MKTRCNTLYGNTLNRAAVLSSLTNVKRGYQTLSRRGGFQTLPPLGVSHARRFGRLEKGQNMAVFSAVGADGGVLIYWRGGHRETAAKLPNIAGVVFGKVARARVCAQGRKRSPGIVSGLTDGHRFPADGSRTCQRFPADGCRVLISIYLYK